MKINKAVALLCIGFSVAAWAEDPLTNALDDHLPKMGQAPWYYEIGGEEYVILPQYDRTQFRMGARLNWNGNLMCGNIDPSVSMDAFMNGLKEGWVQLQDRAISTVQGTIASLPGLALQHIDPGLYEMISTGFIQAEELFQIELADCRKITKDLAKSKPNYDWINVSGFEKYRDYFNPPTGSPDTPPAPRDISDDMGEVVEKAEQNAGKEGIEWLCESKAGGDGQAPIRSSDVFVAAYNKLLDRAYCDESALNLIEGAYTPSFVYSWDGSDDAREWFKDVLGESEVYTTPNQRPLSKEPGTGLMPRVEKTAADLKTKLGEMVASRDDPTLTQLREVSFTSSLVSLDLINAIKGDPNRGMFISRLAVDVALERELKRAMEARRLLYVGMDIEQVASREPSHKLVANNIERLSAEISMIQEEMEVRKMLSSSTAPFVMRREAKRNAEAIQDHLSTRDSIVGRN